MTIDLIPTPVPVTEVHISHGVRFRCYSCPLALAVDELLIDGYSAHVSPSDLFIDTTFLASAPYWDLELGKVVRGIPLPDDAIRFVEDFDYERPVSPKVFTIPLPRHLLRNPPPLSPAVGTDPGRDTRDAPRP